MPSIMVYTEETYYFSDDITVNVRQEYFEPDKTRMTFMMDHNYWFGDEFPESIYDMQGLLAFVIYKMKEYGHAPEFLYSQKKIEYSCSEKKDLDTVTFYITESNVKGLVSVMEQIDGSMHYRAWNISIPFTDFKTIREHTDTVFYGSFMHSAS